MSVVYTNFFGGPFFGGGFFGPGVQSDTHDGGHWKRRKDAKYGDDSIERGNAAKQARRVAIEQAVGVVLPKPIVEAPEPPKVAANTARRIQLPQSKGITPTEPDAIDLRMKQMEEDEQIVMFIASQLH